MKNGKTRRRVCLLITTSLHFMHTPNQVTWDNNCNAVTTKLISISNKFSSLENKKTLSFLLQWRQNGKMNKNHRKVPLKHCENCYRYHFLWRKLEKWSKKEKVKRMRMREKCERMLTPFKLEQYKQSYSHSQTAHCINKYVDVCVLSCLVAKWDEFNSNLQNSWFWIRLCCERCERSLAYFRLYTAYERSKRMPNTILQSFTIYNLILMIIFP